MNSGVQTPKEMHPVVSEVHVDAMNITSILSNHNVTIKVSHEVDEDEARLLAMGLKQELKREMGGFSVFAVSFSVLGLLPSIAACFDYQQLVVGMSPLPWIIAMIFITCVALSMAEVSSAFPSSAGTPAAVGGLLTNSPYGPIFTYMTSWLNWFCQITASPSVSYSCASMMLALYAFTDSSYSPTNGQVFGLATGIQFASLVMSIMPTKWVARFGSTGTILNMLFLTVVFVMILAGNERDKMHPNTSKFNSNGTAWGLDNQVPFPLGIAFLMLFLGVAWAMSGYDSPFHLSEECSNASVVVPRAICLTLVLGGLIGFMFMIAISYTLYSIEEIAADPQGLGQPFVTYLTQIMDKKLVIAATALTVISSFFMAQNCLLAALRVTFAYSRDGLFPFSNIWKQVSPLTKTPVNAVVANFVLGELCLLLVFTDSNGVGISAIFSVGAIAGFVSFTVPTLIKITYARNSFKPGPWNLGRLSEPIGWVSVAFVLVMIPIFCFPWNSGSDLNAANMNWTCVVYFGPMSAAGLWYAVRARKSYVGPRITIDPANIVYGDKLEDGSEVPDVIDGQRISLSSTEKR
ncbi:putative polyamine transporter [Candida viswanathii]|uniref:Putative polyamine transporter n=1 Tax=Candida viswanathii TaxID=5486 RepID=A0A367XS51_9ASCO|nr:putative polyamine transporter [Candida viswanathii]